jgi:hypothetical protein
VNLVDIARIALTGICRGLIVAVVKATIPMLRGIVLGARIALR